MNVGGFTGIRRRLIAAGVAVALALGMVPAQIARADDGLHRSNRAYTQWYVDRAKEAAAAASTAAATLAAARQHLAAAQANLEAVKARAAATVIAVQQATAAVAEATAAVEAAAATYAALAATAKVAAATAAAWTAGTLVGQGINAAWAWCWDPVCDLQARAGIDPERIYRAPDDGEVMELTAEVMQIANGSPFDIEFALERGGLARTSVDYVGDLVRLSLITLRGTAAHSAKQHNQVIQAAEDMKRVLVSLKRNQMALAEGLATLRVDSGLDVLVPRSRKANAAIETTLSKLQALMAEGTVNRDIIKELITGLKKADQSLAQADSVVHGAVTAGVPFGRLDEMMGPPITTRAMEAFARDCALRGAECLPMAEVMVMELLMKAAGVSSASGTPIGEVIAEWDARGLDDWEAARFAPENQLSAAGLAARYMAAGTSSCGYWMDIQPDMSPLVIAARKSGRIVDPNRDGRLDHRDFVAVRDATIGLTKPLGRVDLDGDGRLSYGDLKLLKAAQLGLPVRDNCPAGAER